jgi:hypothetical protein
MLPSTLWFAGVAVAVLVAAAGGVAAGVVLGRCAVAGTPEGAAGAVVDVGGLAAATFPGRAADVAACGGVATGAVEAPASAARTGIHINAHATTPTAPAMRIALATTSGPLTGALFMVALPHLSFFCNLPDRL